MNHKRRNGTTLEQRVYRWVKKRENVTAREVAVGIRVGYWAAVQAIMRLCRKGCLSKTGYTYRRIYNATDLAPEDYRGTAVNSLTALKAGMQKPKARVIVPQATTALEQAWGWGLLNFSDLHAKKD